MPDEPQHSGVPRYQLAPGQTLLFLGEYTSPDNPGYLNVMRGVLARFHPNLKLNLISAGGMGQLAAGLLSRRLMELLTSARPDWLVLGLGLGDAMQEPVARKLLEEYRHKLSEADEQEEATFGPEYSVRRADLGPASDIGPEPELELEHLPHFAEALDRAVTELQSAGVRSILLTTILVGNDLRNPVNRVLKSYNKAIREVAARHEAPLVDLERAFRNVFDRAANYKQQVALTGPQGEVNAQGEALLARTFLDTFGLLPYPGFRAK